MQFSNPYSRKLIFLVLLAVPAYFFFSRMYNHFSKETFVPPAPSSSLLPCDRVDPSVSVKRANSVFNASLSLEKIDKLAQDEFNRVNCLSIHNTAKPKVIIIVPYRDRAKDLLTFLIHMLPYTRYQGAKMQILVVEQNGTAPFNRAKLFNAAIREIDMSGTRGKDDRLAGSVCFSLHDIDKLPIHPDVPYVCKSGPHQLLRNRKSTKGTYWTYPGFLGGVTMFSREQLERMNGASNSFEGWGGEDDDMSMRVRMSKMSAVLAPVSVGEFYEASLEHTRNLNPQRMNLLTRPDQFKIMLTDGLRQTNYTCLQRIDYKSFVWMLMAI
ncbi:unnamed protein product [Mesocestoides corti]|uniref:Beta-1,4-galactosyltransferase n=1 Tax=Mesocestoides corti TaxID=53468 RepID=A0A0R3U4Z9_MESCO|nr:unnamed protein product [Mesocestoides corti]